MTVTVTGLERFLSDIKRCYRTPGGVTQNPEASHVLYHESNGGTLVESGLVTDSERQDLVDRWEADPRTLFAHFLQTVDGRISYRLYEVAPRG